LQIVQMDLFAALFAHTAPTAQTFFSGNLRATAQFTERGHLHLLKAGALTLSQSGAADIVVSEPSLLFFPRGRAHRFTGATEGGADLVCATVDLGATPATRSARVARPHNLAAGVAPGGGARVRLARCRRFCRG
jgi:hypothetical protein